MSLDYFRRGRGLIILAGLAAVLLIGAIVVASSAIGRVLLVCAVVVGFVFAVMSISARKKSEGLTKEALRRNSRLEKQLQEIYMATQEQDRRAAREPMSLLTADLSEKPDEERHTKQSIFAPSTIPASRILGRPDAHTAGRLAAEQTMDSDSSEVLHALMSARSEMWARRIELIGSHDSAESLQNLASVERLASPHLLGKPLRGASYLVIEESQFERGLWSGLLSTQKTSSFLRLLDHMTKAKENGTVVIVCPSETSNHFSEELRQRATVVISKNSTTWSWDDDIYAPVFRALLYGETERNSTEEGKD